MIIRHRERAAVHQLRAADPYRANDRRLVGQARQEARKSGSRLGGALHLGCLGFGGRNKSFRKIARNGFSHGQVLSGVKMRKNDIPRWIFNPLNRSQPGLVF
jgi:hypothetical protein